MALKLFLLFTIIPSFELWLLIKVGNALGVFETIMLIIITGAIGASLARRQGSAVLLELKAALQSGQSPGLKITEGVLVLGGGLLLVTPGIFTDLVGFTCMIPLFRQSFAPFLHTLLLKRFNIQKAHSQTTAEPRATYSKPKPKKKVKESKPKNGGDIWDHPIAD